ncbi:MAG: GNAT family N-acetyltransferase [Candidatus Nanopelagicales bacterium]|nr:GNAT family N-acetyltransferase [Candidatus Nanopelagicales bacterium]
MSRGRVLAEAVRDLPPGLRRAPARPSDAAAITALFRADDLAYAGHTTSNEEEVVDELGGPHCGWERGAACVWRDGELVGLVACYDELAMGRGWWLEVLVLPGDRQAHVVASRLIEAGLREGAIRWASLRHDAGGATADAKAACYADDHGLRRALEDHGFAEVRRFWRMGIDLAPRPVGDGDPAAFAPPGYRFVRFTDGEADWRAMHAAQMAAFLDHFDFVPVGYEEWRGLLQGGTEDRTQWLIAEPDDAPGTVAAWVRGSNRYAAEGTGYVASIGSLREHRGRGLARALLQARFADDARRGFRRTLLDVDAESPTGATRLYEAVGMRVDAESVSFRRPLLA